MQAEVHAEMVYALYLLLGLFAGALSGLIGIGGGIVIVPTLVFGFGLSQKMAQGTTLGAMVPPIGILAAYVYYKAGFVDLKVSALIALGFILGGLLGARFATSLDRHMLEKIFGVITILVGIKMLLSK